MSINKITMALMQIGSDHLMRGQNQPALNAFTEALKFQDGYMLHYFSGMYLIYTYTYVQCICFNTRHIQYLHTREYYDYILINQLYR